MKMLQKVRAVGVRSAALVLAVLVPMLTLVDGAHATIDASVGTAFTAVETDATSLAGIVVPIIVAILGMLITIKLIKRFGNKI